MRLFVGNLSLEVVDEDLRQVFEPFGEVAAATVVTEKFSSESRGFGFVDMRTRADAQSAIDGMNGKEWKGRTLTVNEASPRPRSRQNSYKKGGRRHDSRRRGGKRGSGKRRTEWSF
jgi:RNA recognition motif-containing protein